MKCICKICGNEFFVEPKKHKRSGQIIAIEFNGCQCGTVIKLASTDIINAVSNFHKLTGNSNADTKSL